MFIEYIQSISTGRRQCDPNTSISKSLLKTLPNNMLHANEQFV